MVIKREGSDIRFRRTHLGFFTWSLFEILRLHVSQTLTVTPGPCHLLAQVPAGVSIALPPEALQGKCLLDMELRENLGAAAPWSQVCPSFWELAVLLEAVWAPVVPSRTHLTPPPQSWEILCLFLSPPLFFYIKCLFASNFFQVPLLLSVKPWLSSTASANPLSPLSLPRTSHRHISLKQWRAGLSSIWMAWGGEQPMCNGGKRENIGGKTFKLISKHCLAA